MDVIESNMLCGSTSRAKSIFKNVSYYSIICIFNLIVEPSVLRLGQTQTRWRVAEMDASTENGWNICFFSGKDWPGGEGMTTMMIYRSQVSLTLRWCHGNEHISYVRFFHLPCTSKWTGVEIEKRTITASGPHHGHWLAWYKPSRSREFTFCRNQKVEG